MIQLSHNPATWLKLFAIGGLCGALCDQIHVQGKVLSYAAPVLFDQAWWVAPLFGSASLAMYLAASLWAPFAERQAPGDVSNGEIARHFLWFVAMYALSAGMQQKPLWLCVLYAVLLVRRMVRRRDVPAQLANAAGLAVGGTAFEMALTSTGAFSYRAADVQGVPLWLPGLYLHGAPLALAVVRRIRRAEAGPTR